MSSVLRRCLLLDIEENQPKEKSGGNNDFLRDANRSVSLNMIIPSKEEALPSC